MKETVLSATQLKNMERIPRLNFFNAVSGLKSANLIGTISQEGITNLALFNSIVHIGSDPALLGFIMRPLTVPRHTYANIKASGFYTINLVHEAIHVQAHQCSAKYPEGTSEFEATGLTPFISETHPAPYVQESFIRIGLQFEEEHHIKANGTILIIGRAVEIRLPEGAVSKEGHLNLEAFHTIAVSGLDAYYRVEPLGRLPYARPDQFFMNGENGINTRSCSPG